MERQFFLIKFGDSEHLCAFKYIIFLQSCRYLKISSYSKVRLLGTRLKGTSGYKELVFIPQCLPMS